MPPSTGCCSRVELFDVDGHGTLLSKGPELALPEGEFGEVRLSAYSGGFAWAGALGGGAAPGMHVRFRRGDATVAHTVALDAMADTPDIAAWPFDAAAALSFPRNQGMRLAVVRESGELLVDETVAAPVGAHIQRAPLGTSAHGLVMAFAQCPADFSTNAGGLLVQLRRPGVGVIETVVGVVCHAYAQSLAVTGDVIFVVFFSEEELWGVALVIEE